jgi:hypothetical protein
MQLKSSKKPLHVAFKQLYFCIGFAIFPSGPHFWLMGFPYFRKSWRVAALMVQAKYFPNARMQKVLKP